MNQEMSNIQNKENINRHKESSSLFKSERKEERGRPISKEGPPIYVGVFFHTAKATAAEILSKTKTWFAER